MGSRNGASLITHGSGALGEDSPQPFHAWGALGEDSSHYFILWCISFIILDGRLINLGGGSSFVLDISSFHLLTNFPVLPNLKIYKIFIVLGLVILG